MSVIKLDNITIRKSSNVLLRNFSLQVHEGKITMLCGSHESGKNEILKTMNGENFIASGSVYFNDVVQEVLNPRILSKNKIGYLDVGNDMIDEFNLIENITLNKEHTKKLKIDSSLAISKTKQIMKKYDIFVPLMKKASRATNVEKFYTSIIRMLFRSYKTLIIKEPFHTFTPKEISGFLSVFKKMKNNGITLLLSSIHSSAFDISDNIIFIKKGKVFNTYSKGEVTLSDVDNFLSEINEQKRRVFKSDETNLTLEMKNVFIRNKELKKYSLENFSLKAYSGEIIAITGKKNPAHYSLMKALTGSLRISSGSMMFNGLAHEKKINKLTEQFNKSENELEREILLDEINELNSDARPIEISKMSIKNRYRIGMVNIPQFGSGVGLVEQMTIFENTMLQNYDLFEFSNGIYIKNRNVKEAARKILDVNFIKSNDGIKTKISALETSEKYKFVVGRELAKRSKLIIIAQPSFGINSYSSHKIIEQLIEAADSGKTVIMISYDVRLINSIANKVVFINDSDEFNIINNRDTDISLEKINEYINGVYNG